MASRRRTRSPCKNVNVWRGRIESECLVYQRRQAIHVQSEVDRLAVQVDPQRFVEVEQRTLSNASMTSAAR